MPTGNLMIVLTSCFVAHVENIFHHYSHQNIIISMARRDRKRNKWIMCIFEIIKYVAIRINSKKNS